MKFLYVVGERIGNANRAALVVISIVAIVAVGICWMIKNANRTALIAIAVAVSILLDILPTLAGPLFGGLTGQNDLSNYWISFWSGLAYSAWVATDT